MSFRSCFDFYEPDPPYVYEAEGDCCVYVSEVAWRYEPERVSVFYMAEVSWTYEAEPSAQSICPAPDFIRERVERRLAALRTRKVQNARPALTLLPGVSDAKPTLEPKATDPSTAQLPSRPVLQLVPDSTREKRPSEEANGIYDRATGLALAVAILEYEVSCAPPTFDDGVARRHLSRLLELMRKRDKGTDDK